MVRLCDFVKNIALKKVAITAFYKGFGKHNFTGGKCYIVLCNMFLQYSMAVLRVCRSGGKKSQTIHLVT